MLDIPEEAAALPFRIPTSSCCNCGGTGELELVETPFKHSTYLVFAAVEHTFALEFPYCSRCRRTARRFRHGPFGKLLVVAGVFFVLLLGTTFVPRELTKGFPESWNGWAAAAGALLLSAPFLLFPRVKPPMTSRTQPVSLRKLGRAFSGQITSIALRFTNASYAAEFSRLNREAISEGALKVVVKS